ncbi:alpha/beta fold hydrolase [Aquihabitans daechungensis]|uniref:alpha/beta fold hydrolase n=1 Tax=Aquihabitans daechungensis TaxID=1052257 RepID=UPI003BA26D27
MSSATTRSTTLLTHVKVQLALHELRPGTGRPLLLLHGLGEQTPQQAPSSTDRWPGPVFGLDLTGHGGSSRAPGGGYTAEILMADVDAVLAHLGPVTIVGRGLGAYVALLIAGARPELVIGAVLCDGPGLSGGGPAPQSPSVVAPAADALAAATTASGRPDPFALVELARDVRPDDYATTYARQALQFSRLDTPLAIAAVVRPPWLEAVAAEPGVVTQSLPQALARYAAIPTPPTA